MLHDRHLLQCTPMERLRRHKGSRSWSELPVLRTCAAPSGRRREIGRRLTRGATGKICRPRRVSAERLQEFNERQDEGDGARGHGNQPHLVRLEMHLALVVDEMTRIISSAGFSPPVSCRLHEEI